MIPRERRTIFIASNLADWNWGHEQQMRIWLSNSDKAMNALALQYGEKLVYTQCGVYLAPLIKKRCGKSDFSI